MSEINRRSFFQRWWLLPFVSIAHGLQVHLYSAASKVGPWAGWLTDKAGRVVAFFTRSGEIVWMK